MQIEQSTYAQKEKVQWGMPDQTTIPDCKRYRRDTNTYNVKDIYRIHPDDLGLFFNKENMAQPNNIGEARQTLNLLRDCGYMDGLLKLLNSNAETGIVGSDSDINRRQAIFGRNNVTLPSITSFLDQFARQFEDGQIIMLIIAATIYYIFTFFSADTSKWIQTLTIYGGVVLATAISGWSEYTQEKQFLLIQDEINNTTVTVFRGQYGTEGEVLVKNLVVGDIISVQQGDIVPADCLLIKEMNIAVDETKYGNSKSVEKEPSEVYLSYHEKEEKDNHKENPDINLLTGTMVMSGGGRALVCAVGPNTSLGRSGASNQLVIEGSETPLKKKLEESSQQITKYCIFATMIIVIAMIINTIIVILATNEKDVSFLSGDTMAKVVEIVIIAVCILIVAIPEGMPLAVSLAMALSIQRLKEDSILIKNLEAIQICATLHDVCIGKTGTLTQNKMNVAKMSFINSEVIIDYDQSDPKFFDHLQIPTEVKEVIKRAVIGGTDAWLNINNDEEHGIHKNEQGCGPCPQKRRLVGYRTTQDDVNDGPYGPYYEPKGNDIEKAMLQFLLDNEIDVQDSLVQRNRHHNIECFIPFSNEEKIKIVARSKPNDPENVYVVIQGAPDTVHEKCSGTFNLDSQDYEMSGQQKVDSLKINNEMACLGLVCVSYGYKEMSLNDLQILMKTNDAESDTFKDKLLTDMNYLCSFGLTNELRAHVKEDVSLIKYGKKIVGEKGDKNSVNVRMISGDHLETCIFVAKEAGIINEKEAESPQAVMTGKQFRDKIGWYKDTATDQWKQNYTIKKDTNEVFFIKINEFQKVARHVRVIARATDEDKLLLVEGIKQGGGVPLVSGKCIADARALKAAKVGISMGTGCLVAKENSDLVILNNEFQSIYQSIMWGRTIYENVRKFMQFQLTMNLSLLTTVFIAACSIGKPPFSVIQLLWMNLVMDIFAAAAICTEPFVPQETEHTLQRISRKEKLIKPVMWRNILPQVAYQVTVMIILMFAGQAMYWDNSFNIVTKELREGDQPTDRLRKDTLCFHTFMLMNIINMINCRVVSEHEDNVFRTIPDSRLFCMIFLLELGVQNAFVWLAHIQEGPFKVFGVILGTADMPWEAHLSAWIFGLFVLAIRPATNKIPIDRFFFMDAIDLETKDGKANFVTKWSDRATEDFMRMAAEDNEGAEGADKADGEYKSPASMRGSNKSETDL